jgi:hypothetical protein
VREKIDRVNILLTHLCELAIIFSIAASGGVPSAGRALPTGFKFIPLDLLSA